MLGADSAGEKEQAEESSSACLLTLSAPEGMRIDIWRVQRFLLCRLPIVAVESIVLAIAGLEFLVRCRYFVADLSRDLAFRM